MKRTQNLSLIPLTLLMTTFTRAMCSWDRIYEITFADPSLEAFIREIIKKPSGAIYKSYVERLDSITIDYRASTHTNKESIRDITNLSGLEHFSGLNYLVIRDTGISDLSPLSGLTNLECIILDSNKITDLSPLSGLYNLRYLSIKGSQVKDLSPLSEFTNLTHLHLQDNEISDISPLSNLTNLIELNLCQNQISDTNPLSSLSSLDELYLEENKIRDIAPLLKNNFQLPSRWKQDKITYYVSGIKIHINGNPLNNSSINKYIPQLIETGIVVNY